jgi:hypothetical protein
MKILAFIAVLVFSTGLFGANTPESATSRMFDLIKQKKSVDAIALFDAKKPDQAEFVKSFIAQGVSFMSRVPVQIKVLATFEDGDFAIVAIEQSLPGKPEMTEIEPSHLVKKVGSWLLLSKPDDWTRPINRLDSEAETHFRALTDRYTKFYDEQKKKNGG